MLMKQCKEGDASYNGLRDDVTCCNLWFGGEAEEAPRSRKWDHKGFRDIFYNINSRNDLCVMQMKQKKEGDTSHGSFRDDISSRDHQLGGKVEEAPRSREWDDLGFR